jgi:hypothetical protein
MPVWLGGRCPPLDSRCLPRLPLPPAALPPRSARRIPSSRPLSRSSRSSTRSGRWRRKASQPSGPLARPAAGSAVRRARPPKGASRSHRSVTASRLLLPGADARSRFRVRLPRRPPARRPQAARGVVVVAALTVAAPKRGGRASGVCQACGTSPVGPVLPHTPQSAHVRTGVPCLGRSRGSLRRGRTSFDLDGWSRAWRVAAPRLLAGLVQHGLEL